MIEAETNIKILSLFIIIRSQICSGINMFGVRVGVQVQISNIMGGRYIISFMDLSVKLFFGTCYVVYMINGDQYYS